MSTPPIQQRFPFDLSNKVHPEVEAAIRYAFSGLIDLNQANAVNVAKIAALQTAAPSATATTTTSPSLTVITPVNTPPVGSQWLAGYNSASGNFSQTQPSFADVSGNLDPAQLPTTGISATVALAKITTGGTDGSLTIVNGIVTAYTPPT